MNNSPLNLPDFTLLNKIIADLQKSAAPFNAAHKELVESNRPFFENLERLRSAVADMLPPAADSLDEGEEPIDPEDPTV